MFAETGGKSKDKGPSPLEVWARGHPTAFTVALVLLTILVTLGLLAKPGYTLILYQGF